MLNEVKSRKAGKKAILLIMTLFLSQISFAQFNLVPNPSFEIFDTCPNWTGQIYHAIPWTNPNAASPDYFNACSSVPNVGVPSNHSGNETARTGVAYTGILTANYTVGFPQFDKYREYIQVQLTDSLIGSVDYCIRFYVSAMDSMRYVSNNIGIYFSPTLIPNSGTIFNLPYIPQFENPANNNLNSRNGWTLVSGTYTAMGGERYIVIGNFRDTTTTVSTFTGWGSNIAYSSAAYFIDDVLISPCDSLTGINEQQENSNFTIYPNPSNGIYNIATGNWATQIEVYDILGNLIYSKKYFDKTKNTIDLTSISNGIYFLKINSKTNAFQYKIIKQ